MFYRLSNAQYPQQTISVTAQAWYSLLDLAAAYGWNPVGAVPQLELSDAPPGYESALPEAYLDGAAYTAGQIVQLEDALNLADALESAFKDYEPRRLPPLALLNLLPDAQLQPYISRPSIGAILLLAEFCRLGAFRIEVG